MSNYQFTTPLIIRDGQATRLHRMPFSEKTFDESWLQELLFNHPALIPFHDLEPIFSDSIPVVRELPIANAGFLDLLYMNSKGFLTLVETKLWRNPEARRSVVGQIINYASEMSKWSYEDLVNALNKAGMKAENDPLIGMFLEREGEEFDERHFIDQVSSNLRLGRSLLLIVGDGIQEGVEQMASFLQQTPQLGFNLNLVEVGLYREHPGSEEPIFVQPRILARTREVTRAVVEIKVPLKSSDFEVTLPPEPEKGKPIREKITEKEFFSQLQALSDPRAEEFAKWVLENAEDHGLTIKWGDAGPLLKYDEPSSGKFFNFAQLRRDGLLQTDRLQDRFAQLALPLEICRDYFDEVARLIPNAFRKELGKLKVEQVAYGKNPKPGDFPPFAPLAENREQFMAAIDKAIKRIKEVMDNE